MLMTQLFVGSIFSRSCVSHRTAESAVRLGNEKRLERARWLVFAEYFAKGICDLPDGGLGLHGGNDERNEILRAAGGSAEGGDGGPGGSWIPTGAERSDALDLLALETRVDPMNVGGRRLVNDV